MSTLFVAMPPTFFGIRLQRFRKLLDWKRVRYVTHSETDFTERLSSLEIAMNKCILSVALAGLLFSIGCAPSTFVQQPSGWKSIELREGLAKNYDAAWQT